MSEKEHQVIIVGGGLAGLISAILLKRQNIDVLLIEKKSYPFHRVCGEYISNEVRDFLGRENLFPDSISTSNLTNFLLSDIKGATAKINLPLGGFGISRYAYDHFLYESAQTEGVTILLETEVTDILFTDDLFKVKLKEGAVLKAKFVLGAYGKRAKLDKQLNRAFILKRSPFIGVKYHARLDYPGDQIGLYNFKGGYCGVSQVENGLVNICYLSKKDNLKKYGDIKKMEEKVLYQNPLLKAIFEKAEWQFDRAEVINEISFESKKCVENHVLMIGDTAGLITPLCGNGMAMAIHAAKIASDLLIDFYSKDNMNREELEKKYSSKWKRVFSKRLWIGRNTQNLFGNQSRSNLAVGLIQKFPALGEKIILQTHGEVI